METTSSGRELNHVTFHDPIHEMNNHELVIVNNATPNADHHSPAVAQNSYYSHAHMDHNYSPYSRHSNNCNYHSLTRPNDANGARLDLIQTPLQVKIDDAIENCNFEHDPSNNYGGNNEFQNVVVNGFSHQTNADIITSHPYQSSDLPLESYQNQFNNQDNCVNYETLRRTTRNGILITQPSLNSASSSSNSNSNPVLTASSLSTTSSSLSNQHAQAKTKMKTSSFSSASKPSVSFANDCSYIITSSPNESCLDLNHQ